MPAQTPIREDDPRKQAWDAYTQTDEFKNSERWAKYCQVLEVQHPHLTGSLWAVFIKGFEAATATPIPMLLFCPKCRTQHVDAPEPEREWTNPPHKSHLCHGCGLIWRPADVPTVGVEKINTRGDADTWQPET